MTAHLQAYIVNTLPAILQASHDIKVTECLALTHFYSVKTLRLKEMILAI